MNVEVRPIGKLRGEQPLDVTGALAAVLRVLSEEDVDLSRVRIVCDWVQYRSNFRNPVDVRSIIGIPGGEEDGLEVAIELRSGAGVDLAAATREALRRHTGHDIAAAVPLERWTPGRSSWIWRFNSLYWGHLGQWEQATGRLYEEALPGGESDARNSAGARQLIEELFEVWDGLDERDALPEELFVVEIGVGNGGQARTWLDEFVHLDKEHGRDYYRRLHYLMGDYSPEVLERAEQEVSHHAHHVSSLVVDATRLGTSLRFLRYKAFLVYISNVYDNLPTDELACIDGRVYRVEVRASLPATPAAAIASRYHMAVDELPGLVDKLLRIGPELLHEAAPRHFTTLHDAVSFWRDVWTELRLDERFVLLEGLDDYELAPGLSGEILRPLLEASGDIRMQVSNGAMASFVDTIQLLHPYGRLTCHDLFVTSVGDYRTGFRGPGKYDGSVVNWVNFPLLQRVGARRGFDVACGPFRPRPGANVRTLTAQVRE